jgi:hypothetical protein
LSQIPWKSVGAGWLLATWSPSTASSAVPPAPTVPASPLTLFLVNPAGGRYLVSSLPSSDTLVGWSSDGRRALLESFSGGQSSLTVLDLTTGKVADTFAIAQATSLAFTRPDGSAVLAAVPTLNVSPQQYTLTRYAFDGATQATYPTSFSSSGTFAGSFLETPAGTTVYMWAQTGLAVVSNGGDVLSQFPEPGLEGCQLVRWWSSTSILSSCLGKGTTTPGGGGAPRLWDIPVSGGAPSAVTATPVPPDSGDESGYRLPTGIYTQSAGGCGYVYLAKVQSDATTAPVTIPGVTSGDSQFILGANGAKLAVHATLACSSGQSLLWYDTSTNTTTVVLGPTVNGGSVPSALAYPKTT